jgi:hypothetical protein
MLPADAAHVRTGTKESGRLCKLSSTQATVCMLAFEHAPVSNWMCTALHGFADVVIEFGHNDVVLRPPPIARRCPEPVIPLRSLLDSTMVPVKQSILGLRQRLTYILIDQARTDSMQTGTSSS